METKVKTSKKKTKPTNHLMQLNYIDIFCSIYEQYIRVPSSDQFVSNISGYKKKRKETNELY